MRQITDGQNATFKEEKYGKQVYHLYNQHKCLMEIWHHQVTSNFIKIGGHEWCQIH